MYPQSEHVLRLATSLSWGHGTAAALRVLGWDRKNPAGPKVHWIWLPLTIAMVTREFQEKQQQPLNF